MQYNDVKNDFCFSAANCDCHKNACTKTCCQYANIELPVQLKPKATVGEIITECCTEPTVVSKTNNCNNGCEITITQKICIKIPITYEVATCVGDSKTTCECNNPQCKCQ